MKEKLCIDLNKGQIIYRIKLATMFRIKRTIIHRINERLHLELNERKTICIFKQKNSIYRIKWRLCSELNKILYTELMKDFTELNERLYRIKWKIIEN